MYVARNDRYTVQELKVKLGDNSKQNFQADVCWCC